VSFAVRLGTMLLPLALSGCAAISTLNQASRPLEIYELRTPPVQRDAVRRGNTEIVVEEPVSSGSLATNRILIRPAPLRAQYLPGVRWADPAPVMLQTLLVRTLTDTGAFASVGRRPVGPQADLALLGDLTDFQAELGPDGVSAGIRIRLVLRLVSEREAEVVATRIFAVTEEASSTDAEWLAAAFDRGTTRLLSEIVPWLLAHGFS
jgi:cholesterol transport system auxiliary component